MFCRGKFSETSMLNLKFASVRFHSIKVSIGDSGSLDLSSILGGTIFFLKQILDNLQNLVKHHHHQQ